MPGIEDELIADENLVEYIGDPDYFNDGNSDDDDFDRYMRLSIKDNNINKNKQII